MNIKELKDKWLWKRVDEFWNKDYQCVAWAKQAMIDLFQYWQTYFSKSAINWWKTWSPFNNSWKRINYTKWLIPKPWDIIFFNTTSDNDDWHVALVWEWSTQYKIVVIEQNAWTGNWNWLWANAITERTKTYTNCLGWFTYNNNNIMKTDYKKIMNDLIKSTWIAPILNSHEWEWNMTEWDIRCLIEITAIHLQDRQNKMLSDIVDAISKIIGKK